jgi:hypothetical protein
VAISAPGAADKVHLPSLGPGRLSSAREKLSTHFAPRTKPRPNRRVRRTLHPCRVHAHRTFRVWHVAVNEEAAGAVICGKASKCGISGESAVRHIAGGALRQRPWQQNPSAVRHGSEGRPPLSSAPRRQTATPSASSSSTFAGSAAEPLPECFGVGGGAGSASSVIWPRSRICIYISNSSCRGSIRPSSLSSMLGTVCTATACSFGAYSSRAEISPPSPSNFQQLSTG